MEKVKKQPTEKQLAALAAGRKVITTETARVIGQKGGIVSGQVRRRKAAARASKKYAPIKKLTCQVEIGEIDFVLTGYETEKDLIRAGFDMRRMLLTLSKCLLCEIEKILAPYRETAMQEDPLHVDDK